MRAIRIVAASFIVAAALALQWHMSERPDFEAAVERTVLVGEIQRDDSRCPLSREAIDRVRPWVLAACADGGLGWHEAAERYGADAEKVYLVYGGDPALADVFEALGPRVVPIITYFVRNGSTQYLVQEAIGQGWAQLRGRMNGAKGARELSPEQYGLIAIEELRDRGHEMLSEFEIVNGVAVRKQFTRTLLAAKNVVFGGISDLERVLARGERLPSWNEVGWASVDAVLVVGGIGVAAKSLRLARVPMAATTGAGASRLRLLQGAGRSVMQSLATVGKAAGVAAVVAIPYLALTHPDVLTSAAGWMAEQAGLPGWLGVFVAYFAFFTLIGLLFKVLLGPFFWTLRILRRLACLVASNRRIAANAPIA